MNIRERIKLVGAISLRILSPDGEVLKEWFEPNIVTTIGKQRCASHLGNSVPGKTWFTHIAFGINTDEESTEDLALGTEIYRVVLDTVFVADATVFGSIIIEANDIDDSAAVTIWELGLLDAASGGNLICRHVLSTVVTILGTQQLEVLWGVIVT